MNATTNIDLYGADFGSDQFPLLGFITLFIIIILVIPHLITLQVFINHPFFKTNLTYHVMFHLGIVDCLRLCTFVFDAISLLFPLTNFDTIWINFTCAISWGALVSVNVMTLVLAVNRFDIFVGLKLDWIHNKRLFNNILISLSYILGCLVTCIFMIPGIREYRYIWRWHKEIYGPLFSHIVSYVCYGLMGIACMLYLMSIITVAIQNRLTTSKAVKKAEVVMFLQTFLPCAIKCAQNATWLMITSTDHNIDIFIFYWLRVIEAGYQPYLYYLVNRSFAEAINGLFGKTFIQLTPVQVLATLA